eukprot:4318615-Amphidinium_carterae.1
MFTVNVEHYEFYRLWGSVWGGNAMGTGIRCTGLSGALEEALGEQTIEPPPPVLRKRKPNPNYGDQN